MTRVPTSIAIPQAVSRREMFCASNAFFKICGCGVISKNCCNFVYNVQMSQEWHNYVMSKGSRVLRRAMKQTPRGGRRPPLGGGPQKSTGPNHPPSNAPLVWGAGQTTHPENQHLGGGWVRPPTQQTVPWVGGGSDHPPSKPTSGGQILDKI